MGIFTLSDTASLNSELESTLAYEIKKRGSEIAYVSASPQKIPRPWFQNTLKEYKKIIDSNINLEYFDLSNRFSSERLENILKFGTIHLSGGNTFDFLNSIIERNIQRILKSHLNNGGLIIGVSAGSIILSPSVLLSFISGDNDFNYLKNYNGLNFLPFEFYPHFSSSIEELNKLLEYSNSTPNAILVCNDNDGVFFENNNIKGIGRIIRIQKGNMKTLDNM